MPIDPTADASQLRTMNVSRHGGLYGRGMNTTGPKQGARVLGEEGRWPANFIHDGLAEEWARFFYCAKASRKDRDEGLQEFPSSTRSTMGSGIGGQPDQSRVNNKNSHPTVKPTKLMRYLCRLITPPGGLVLDIFAGSGSTGKAAALEGFQFMGFELNPEFASIANARYEHALRQKGAL